MKREFALSAVIALTLILVACLPKVAPATEATTSAPYITAKDQPIVDGMVWVAAAIDGPGWVAIHAETDGKPGPVIGYAQIPGGVWEDLKVTVDESRVTPRLYAMLHVDAGVAGTYEFPGDDFPVRDGDDIVVMQGFYLLDRPSVAIDNQPITQSTVLTGVIMTTVPSWFVIHADADGEPGPVIGYVHLPSPGRYEGLPVKLDESQATPKLFAMLHIDAGVAGTYEFPGADVPLKNGDMIVMVPFEIK